MKQFKLHYLYFTVALITVLASCRKNHDTPDPAVPEAQRRALYVLNEGSFQGNNSTLTYYNFSSKQLTTDFFAGANAGKTIGDTGNDIQIYGSKVYIVANVSSVVHVADARTAKVIKQVDMKNGTTGRQPRYIVFNKNKALISSYDGTVAVLDTASLTIDKYITVGRNPDYMAIANNKLYVANSGELSYLTGNYDNSVSVIDLNTYTELKKITVTIQPVGVVADASGNIYVQSRGNYGNVASAITIIDSGTDQVKSTMAFSGSSLHIAGDNLYYLSGGKVKVLNIKTQAVTDNFITDGTTFTAAYSMNLDAKTGEVFVTDAKNYSVEGTITAFDKDGKKEYTLNTGVIPGGIAFLYY